MFACVWVMTMLAGDWKSSVWRGNAGRSDLNPRSRTVF